MSEGTNNPPKTWKEKGAEWLFQQGTSTVLLFLLLGFICYAMYTLVPQHITAINGGYEKQAKELTESSERTMKMVVDSHERDREAWVADRKTWLEMLLKAKNVKASTGDGDPGT